MHDQSPSYGSASHPSSVRVESVDRSVECPDGMQTRTLGIMFRDLRVVGLDVGTAIQHNLLSLFSPRSLINYIHNLRHPPVRDIISGFEGAVFPGEMLLVLGRPGSGCTTFLKTLANHRGEYHSIFGDVFYDSFTSEEIEKQYRGDVIYCPEDDVHFRMLTVRQTLEFASTMRTPAHRKNNHSREAHATHTTEALMRVFGLQHTKDTIVGDEFFRGISGGEKKRVSLAEVMSARGKLVCWDNSTRGLDSSTALDFIRILRNTTDTASAATVASIYQAGEQLFELFDKVCVIYEGKLAYFGPAKEAKQYFMDMGYEPKDRQTTPDFLVASTDPNGRVIKPGFQGTVPRTADEMAAYFKTSIYGQLNRSSMKLYSDLYVNNSELKRAYDMSATSEHARQTPSTTSFMLSIPMQVRAVMHRRLQILMGDRATLAAQVGSQIFQGIFIGTTFLKMGDSTDTYFSRGSVFNFTLFCTAILSLADVLGGFSQRLIVLRHEKAALYYPFIDTLAHFIVDIPITFLSVTVMSLILYFLVGLQRTVDQFITFLLFMFVTILVLKACFRSISAFCTSESIAIPLAGATSLSMLLYNGYGVPIKNMVRGLRWVSHLNPLRYVFESLLVSGFHKIEGTCALLVPSGPGYENITIGNQVCAIAGSQSGVATVSGDVYTFASFGYSYSNLWKNFGILCVFGSCYLGVLLLLAQFNKRIARDTTVTLYKEGSVPGPIQQAADEEKLTPGLRYNARDLSDYDEKYSITFERPEQADIFSWKNIQYHVPVSGEMRKLLDDVSGYITPGTLTALMGESGAGKTVLLDVIAQHISGGVMQGDCLLNGRPLQNFAYVQQMDIHIPESTVREALLFSARLRQPASVPLAEKDAYADKCLKMCGLEAYADAIVGSLGVEHKKRTTIAVELAAKPKLLLFLDEPTSGLDSQSAWAIVKFLRELADNGLAILCTIHQPSGELFQLFDRLLLLQKGGKTVYFGDIGERSMTMIEYFQRNGAAHCPADANPAEYMLDAIGAGITATCTTDWSEVWKNSPEAEHLEQELNRIHQVQSDAGIATRVHSEFASSWMKQLMLLTQRGFICYWRDPSYVHARLFVCIFTGLLIGFTYFGTTNSLQGVQSKVFSVLLIVAVCVPMAHQLQGKFIESRAVYEVREHPSKIYTWSAFLVSQILIEIPLNILAMTLLFVCWYWAVGFESSRIGFSCLFYCIVFPLYYITFGLAIAVVSPNGTIATILASISASFAVIFTGVIQVYPQLGWWKWMYYVSPFTYILEGISAQAIGRQLVTCTAAELVAVEPPLGMSCGEYMDPFIAFAGGYLTNPNATSQCGFCHSGSTDQLLKFFNMSYEHHWRDLVVVLLFIVFNTLFMFAGMYLRIHKGLKYSFEKIE